MSRTLKLRAWSVERQIMLYQSHHSLQDFMKRLEGWGEVLFMEAIHPGKARDITGKDVYEGDYVVWREYSTPTLVEYFPDRQAFIPFTNSTTKIVGNIYQNPDLALTKA